MENEGKYVRMTGDSDDQECTEALNVAESVSRNDAVHEDDSSERSDESTEEEGDYQDDSIASDTSHTSASGSDEEVTKPDHGEQKTQAPQPTSREHPETLDRLERMEKYLAELTRSFDTYARPATSRAPAPPEVDAIWTAPNEFVDRPPGTTSVVRWDHIKAFPSGVPANKMWEAWNRHIENFEIAASLGNASDPIQRSQLLFLTMGEELQGIVRAAKLRPKLSEPNCYTTFVKNVQDYLRSMTDTAAEHEAFSNMSQEVGESAVSFHAKLMEKVRLCGYSPSDQDRFVRAQLLKGLRNKELVKAARTYGHETNFIVQSATREEAYQAEAARPSNEPGVFAIQQKNWKRPATEYRKRGREDDEDVNRQAKRYHGTGMRKQGRRSRCPRCNRFSHPSNKPCPALSKSCNACGERGHFVATCRKKRVNMVQQKQVKLPGWSEDEEEDTKQKIYALSLKDVLVDCCIGNFAPVEFMIDSGADVNVIGGVDWKRLKRALHEGTAQLQPIEPSLGKGLQAYGSNKPMSVKCAFQAPISVPGTEKPSVIATFYVVGEGRRSLLGRSTASDLKLLQVGPAVNSCEISDDQVTFPKIPGVSIKFTVDKTVTPIRNAYYNVPAALREGARNRLLDMENQGIIEKITKAPEWISGMSAVPKGKDDFRLVVNMRGPNKAIQREYYRLPLVEEMKVKLHGAKCFSKLDLSSAYYHLELCEESRDLTTFLTESGMFRFTRLMFGVNCAPEIFQREMVRILEGIENVIVYIDDILLFAATLEGLRKTVTQVMERLNANNLTLNTAKCEFDKSRIKFLGHELDQDGFHVEEAKVQSILGFRQPATISELRSFLGLASFVSPHIQNFADITNPLWAAVSKNAWTWGTPQQNAFDTIKKRIAHCTVSLGFFSNDAKTVLYTDASPVALGAVLVQECEERGRRIISFASKALTITEKKYPQNQREALSAVWAVEHFSYFLLGRRFTLRTDAQGVMFILNRTREDSKRALTRADGWALRLSPYDYEVEYVRGKDNIADPSSRLYSGSDDHFDEETSPWEVATIEANAAGFLTENEIIEHTAQDATLQQLIVSLQTGEWPANLRKFQSLEPNLAVRSGLVVKTGCAVIPEALRKKALEVAHEGHPSAAKMKTIMRQRVWWPGMSGDAEKWVQSCSTCAMNGQPEKTTPMQRILGPEVVWDTIALNFNGPYARYGGISILVIVDYRSRYLIAKPVKSTSFVHTKSVLELVFEKEGFPRNIKTDNGPPFNGEEYKRYCAERGINTIFSTPLFPQQNGLVEGYMKIINKAMVSATTNSTNFVEELRVAVHAHNAAAHRITNAAPEEVMSGRKIKRGLPLLRHERVDIDNKLLNERDRKAKLLGKQREDARRRARTCQVMPGDVVLIERPNRAKGDSRFFPTRYTVVEERNGNLSLNDESGHVFSRHVSQTKKVYPWRGANQPEDTDDKHHQSNDGGQKSNEDGVVMQREQRAKRAPKYLKDYVQAVEKQ